MAAAWMRVGSSARRTMRHSSERMRSRLPSATSLAQSLSGTSACMLRSCSHTSPTLWIFWRREIEGTRHLTESLAPATTSSSFAIITPSLRSAKRLLTR
eukprot:2737126-Rhodomonas_salina.2